MLGKRGQSAQSTLSPEQRLQIVARSAPADMEEVREAVLRGHTEEDLIEEGRRWRPEQIIEDTADIYTEASNYFSRGGTAAASRVRGCSRQLLTFAAKQALALADLLGRRKAEEQTRETELERGRASLQQAFERAAKMRDQSRSVLLRVAGSDPSFKAQINAAALVTEDNAELSTALVNIAVVGRQLMAENAASSLQLTLYGLDGAYLTEVEEAGKALDKAEHELDELMNKEGIPDHEVHLCAGINIKLMLQILDAFLGGHELYPDVPMLTPTHHENLLRRISRLPPPPSPGGIKVRMPPKKGATKEREKSRERKEIVVATAAGPVRLGRGLLKKR